MPLWRVVSALGIAQIIAWGSLYYPIAVLSGSMRTDLRVSEPFIFGAFSLCLLMSGFAAPSVGAFIDRRGGRVALATS